MTLMHLQAITYSIMQCDSEAIMKKMYGCVLLTGGCAQMAAFPIVLQVRA